MSAATIPADVDRRTISETWGATGIWYRHRVLDDLSWPSGRVRPLPRSADHLPLAMPLASARRLSASPAWTRIVRIRSGRWPITRVFAASAPGDTPMAPVCLMASLITVGVVTTWA